MRSVFAAIAFLISAPLLGAEVRVFAAASLTEALTEIGAEYERATGEKVVFNFGGSNMLARQIASGAPADLFFSADEAQMDALQRQGLIDAPTRASLLSNSLVVISRLRIRGPRDLIGKALALAEPSTVPAGIYAKGWLQREGLWDRLARDVIPTENVRAALAAVERGNADAAIVYATDVRIARGVGIAYVVPRSRTPRISYVLAIATAAENVRGARRLHAYLQTPAARRVFARHGFLVQ